MAPILPVTVISPPPDLTTKSDSAPPTLSSSIVELKLISPSCEALSESTVVSPASFTAPVKVIDDLSSLALPVELYTPSRLIVAPVILIALISSLSVVPLAPIP